MAVQPGLQPWEACVPGFDRTSITFQQTILG
jgi:hypothetical protein